MHAREAFGPSLRRIRLRRGITLEQIARETKVNADLWEALERNDFARWPSGIFARAYLRSYARLIGVDPEATVDEFCRSYSKGDRRARRLVAEQARIVDHEIEWRDNPPPGVTADRRAASRAERSRASRVTLLPVVKLFMRLRRAADKT
jgi:cytoskeletal protein RodZ